MKAEIACPLCKVRIAILQDAQVEEAIKLFKNHLPSHTLSEIYDFNVRNASQLFPLINWDDGKSSTAVS
jgi:uncharacterized protein YbaR (Trm112 family)